VVAINVANLAGVALNGRVRSAWTGPEKELDDSVSVMRE